MSPFVHFLPIHPPDVPVTTMYIVERGTLVKRWSEGAPVTMGVGAVVALTYSSTIDQRRRFDHSRTVGNRGVSHRGATSPATSISG